jgi:hypothetical protein
MHATSPTIEVRLAVLEILVEVTLAATLRQLPPACRGEACHELRVRFDLLDWTEDQHRAGLATLDAILKAATIRARSV